MRFRLLNRCYANMMGYYWKPCKICGQMYGGHEAAINSLENGTNTSDMVCKDCNDRAEEMNIENGYRNKVVKL